VDEAKGIIMDYGEITTAAGPILDQLDHHYLNEIEGLENPTSENLVRWIWDRLKPILPLLNKVVVQETCTSRCSYSGS
jgi:6-pyruvoyltetrahydropterin/6-carboxytetrahydropterin synthase